MKEVRRAQRAAERADQASPKVLELLRRRYPLLPPSEALGLCERVLANQPGSTRVVLELAETLLRPRAVGWREARASIASILRMRLDQLES